MPHLVLTYTADLEAETRFPALCQQLAAALAKQCDADGRPTFPTGGIRVLAIPAAHSAVADGKGEYGFLYANLRIAGGREPDILKKTGDTLLDILKQHFDTALARRPIGITLQIDAEGKQVYDRKHSSLHPIFANKV
ncbi:MAG: 5-carboxymethyl-2-hydroxymuconate isomerase [Lautropia sp.]|nr:5-carboxymethyl-2-hydroxymuconate isomerase [Lautropia sp.]